MELQEVYKQLRANNLCRSGHQFSVQYLGKKRSYMSVMISSQRQPSVHALMCLYFKLNEQADLLHDDNIEVLYQTRCKLLSISEEVMKTVQEKCK